MVLGNARACGLGLAFWSVLSCGSTAANAQTATSYYYDTLGRAITVADGHGSVTNFAYDAAGNRTLVDQAAVGVSSNTGTLLAGQSLLTGQTLYSQDGRFRLFLQPGDGNLVLYDSANTPLWNGQTLNRSAVHLAMQTDGNLVLYGPHFAPIWNSGTGGTTGNRLVLQNDGNLVIYSAQNAVVWSTQTGGH